MGITTLSRGVMFVEYNKSRLKVQNITYPNLDGCVIFFKKKFAGLKNKL